MADTEARPTTDVRQWRMAQIDPDTWENVKPAAYYQRSLDTLIIHLFGEARPSVGFLVGDYVTVRIDPETDEPSGFEINHFLSEAVVAQPELVAFVELRSIGFSRRDLIRVRWQLRREEHERESLGTIIERASAAVPTSTRPSVCVRHDQHLPKKCRA